jgi:hypothetical protein
MGRKGKVTFSGPGDEGYLRGEHDKVSRGCAGFKTEKVEFGFQFRCVKCNRNVRVTKAN